MDVGRHYITRADGSMDDGIIHAVCFIVHVLDGASAVGRNASIVPGRWSIVKQMYTSTIVPDAPNRVGLSKPLCFIDLWTAPGPFLQNPARHSYCDANLSRVMVTSYQ